MNETQQQSVTDLAFVTFLRVTRRLPFVECRMLHDGTEHCEFIFAATPEQLREAESAFLNGGEASVSATIVEFKEVRGAINRARRREGVPDFKNREPQKCLAKRPR
jgi:hypothetical protein